MMASLALAAILSAALPAGTQAQTTANPAPKAEGQPSPPVVTPNGEHRIKTPAAANNPTPISATQIIDAVRHPEAGIKAVRAARPADGISIIHLNTTVKGDNRRAAIKVAASQRLKRIQQLRAAVENIGWLTTKLQSMHVDPTALIGAASSKAGPLLLFAY